MLYLWPQRSVQLHFRLYSIVIRTRINVTCSRIYLLSQGECRGNAIILCLKGCALEYLSIENCKIEGRKLVSQYLVYVLKIATVTVKDFDLKIEIRI